MSSFDVWDGSHSQKEVVRTRCMNQGFSPQDIDLPICSFIQRLHPRSGFCLWNNFLNAWSFTTKQMFLARFSWYSNWMFSRKGFVGLPEAFVLIPAYCKSQKLCSLTMQRHPHQWVVLVSSGYTCVISWQTHTEGLMVSLLLSRGLIEVFVLLHLHW